MTVGQVRSQPADSLAYSESVWFEPDSKCVLRLSFHNAEQIPDAQCLNQSRKSHLTCQLSMSLRREPLKAPRRLHFVSLALTRYSFLSPTAANSAV